MAELSAGHVFCLHSNFQAFKIFISFLEILPERNWVSRAKLSHSQGILVTGCWNYGPGSQNAIFHPRVFWSRWKTTWI